jgi:signal transduction histidine kinase
MKLRAKLINAQLFIASNESGTSITLQYPLIISNEIKN